MNTLHDFVMLEYSLIISIAGTIIGLIVAIVGVACSKKTTVTIVGIVLLIVFLLLCVVILKEKYFSGISNSGELPAFSGETDESKTGLTDVAETSSASTATSKPIETLPVPTATLKPVETLPAPTATPEPVEISPVPTAIPTDEPQSELILDIEPIMESLYNVLPITLLEDSISPVEIKTFSGNISSLQQVDDYSFVPEVDGTYRFEFSDVPSGTYYNLYVFNSGNERLKYNTYLGNGGGVTISLVAGQSYNITLAIKN